MQSIAFGDERPVDVEQAERDFAREGIDGSTFVALLDGDIVAAAYAAYTPWGLLLFGGATLARARGRGAYRALVAARAREARGARHAGARRSRRADVPTDPRAARVRAGLRIDRLVDVLTCGDPRPRSADRRLRRPLTGGAADARDRRPRGGR